MLRRASAKGKFLLFLNNDTQVLPHWLDPLLKPFAEDLRGRGAGSKLLYPDGSLQEAGGIIWERRLRAGITAATMIRTSHRQLSP